MPNLSLKLVSLFLFSVLAAVGAELKQRVIIADFEDVGTWRASAYTGVKSGMWFSADLWMGASLAPAHAGDHSGELRFAFANETTQPRRILYRRVKMSQVSGFLEGIEFDADSRGLPVSLRFGLIDSNNKRHWTPPVRLGEAGWKHYKSDISEAKWPEAVKVAFPAAVELVILESDVGCEGFVLMDDLALTGGFARKDQIAITPIYSSINYEPGKPVVLHYRVRNARTEASTVTLSAALAVIGDAAGPRPQTVLSRTLELPAQCEVELSLDFGVLANGPWILNLRANDTTDERIAAVYLDTFGVFSPNEGRPNKRPMWFGIQDLNGWQGEGENALHIGWMKRIGFDINRLGMTGSRFLPEAPASIAAWRPLLDSMEQADINTTMIFGEMPPFLMGKNGYRGAPNDLAAYERYSAEVGKLLRGFPHVRYVEFWNEPDISFYNGTLAEYWDMFGAFSRGFRSTSPGIKITTGGSTVSHPKEKPGFSQSLYTEHGDLYDVAAFHAHGPLSNYSVRHNRLEKWMTSAGLDKPIVNTESGARSGYEPRGYLDQAIVLVQKLAWAKSRPRTEFHIWFTLQDYWDMDPDADDSFGLITSDNRAKPSLIAYNELIRQLANTTPLPPSFAQPGLETCEFVRDDGKQVLVVWTGDGSAGGTLWIHPERAPVQKIDIFGRAETLAAGSNHAVNVGASPIYLVSSGPAPLAVLSADKIELDAPAEIFRDATVPTTFAATVRNPGATAADRTLVLRNAAGDVVTRKLRLAANAVERVTLTVPVVTESGSGSGQLSSHAYTLVLVDASDTVLVSLPVVFRDSYPIVPEGKSTVAATIDLGDVQSVTELTFDPTIPAWRGPADLSARARVTRDGEMIVFRIDVTDDKHLNNGHADSELWRADSVQIAFYNPATTAHTLFDAALVDGKREVVWCYRNADPKKQGLWAPSDVRRSIRREGNLTRYEIRVPFALLGISAADISSAGLPVRFSYLINEDDGQGRVRWMRSSGGLGDSQDITPLGHAILQ
ncbi:MAG: sugar-binding protein [Opitutaceae bacterium]|jgi:hypothetical protein